MALPRVADRGG